MLQTERVTEIAKRTDRSRLVTAASGWHDKPCGDIIDMHVYPGPGELLCAHIVQSLGHKLNLS